VAKRWLDWVNFGERWLVFPLSYARKVQDLKEYFGGKLNEIELDCVEQTGV